MFPKFSPSKLIVLLLGVAALVVMVYKAAHSSFTHDESFSFIHYNDWSYMDILSFRQGFTNLHILNSLGMKLSAQIIGATELALRMPNLLALGVYMIYGFLLFRKAKPLLLVAVFVLLLANVVFLDMFGVARGYGLSFGFMLMSLYHFVQSFDAHKTRHLILFHLGGLLAILSSFVMLDVYVSLLLIYQLMVVIDRKWISKQPLAFWANNKVHLFCLLVVGGVLYEPMRRFLKYSHLDFGGKNGFFGDTVPSLVETCLHGFHITPGVLIVANVLITVLVLVTTGIVVCKIIQRDVAFFAAHKGLIISSLLVLSMSAAIILQHLLFHADYPVGRFSLFLFPIFMVQFGFLLVFLGERFPRAVPMVALVLAAGSVVGFVSKVDLRTSTEWRDDMETKNMLQVLSEYHARQTSDPQQVQLGISWFFEPTINFYRQIHHLDWLMEVDRNGCSPDDTYYYMFEQDLGQVDQSRCEVIVRYEDIHTVLLRNRGK